MSISNSQLIEKVNKDPLGKLFVHSVFPTLQGEGPYSGTRAVFIRLAGCNLQCPGCDTDYTSQRVEMHADTIVEKVKGLVEAPYLVVITGGEPFRQNVNELCGLLITEGFHVQIETNGTLEPSPNLNEEVMIVCSPKTGTINPKMQQRMDALKYVINWRSVTENGLPLTALGHSAKPHLAQPLASFRGPVYVQPMDSGDITENHMNRKAAVKVCLEHGAILQLQIHKLLGVE